MLWEDKLSSHNRTFTSGRFFYPVTIYIIDLGDFCILYNFFYKTDLERFQAVTEYALIRDSKYNKHLAKFNKRI
jgi:hypothetical protein